MTLSVPGQPTADAPAFDVASIKPSQAARAGGEGSGRERIAVSPTGLTLAGVFDITLDSAAREMLADPASIFAAIERAGFKLESRKAPIEVLIVDHAAQPSEN